jgi:hypothetical protein
LTLRLGRGRFAQRIGQTGQFRLVGQDGRSLFFVGQQVLAEGGEQTRPAVD